MQPIMIIFEVSLIVIGAFFLLLSLTPIKQLILEIPDGNLKLRWKILSVLIFFFIACYFVFGYNLWNARGLLNSLSMVVSILLFFGGIFVYLVGQLALQTISDVKDIAILKQESITDALTGLKNRRYFDQRIYEEVALSKRYNLPLSLILMDVDHFKKINDTYGHIIGDEVLSNLSTLVLDIVRDSDIVARYGGEEIAIIAPNTNQAESERLAERLRSKIEKMTVAIVGETQENVHVTVSLGVCALSHAITDKEALLEEADQALYAAKKDGRNRTVVSKG